MELIVYEFKGNKYTIFAETKNKMDEFNNVINEFYKQICK